MIHYPTDERLKNCTGPWKRHTNDSLGSKICLSGSPQGKSGFIDAGQLNHISCTINCYFAFFLLLSIVSLPHIEDYFLFTFSSCGFQLWVERCSLATLQSSSGGNVVSCVSVVRVASFILRVLPCYHIWPLGSWLSIKHGLKIASTFPSLLTLLPARSW